MDAKLLLDNALRNKPRIVYTKQRTRRVERCRSVPCHPGMDGLCDPFCWYEDRTENVDYSDYAVVTDTSVSEVKDLEFSEERLVTLPEKILISRQTYQNCDNVRASVALNLSVSGTKSYNIALSKSVSTTRGLSAGVRFGGVFGGFNTNVTVSTQVQFGQSTSEGDSETITRSFNATIQIPEQTSGMASLMVYQTSIEIPFKAKLLLDGKIKQNKSGFSKASEILSVEERTFIVEGILQASSVSEAKFKTTPLPDACAIRMDPDEATRSESESLEFFVDEIDAAETNDYQALTDIDLSKPIQASIATEKDSIGPVPDGIHYSIIYTKRVARPDVRCGFNDIGFPNTAIFNVEGRDYVQYINNQAVAKWFEEVEIFDHCYTV